MDTCKYFKGVDEITERLDKIVVLLQEMQQKPNIITSKYTTQPFCNCGEHTIGQESGGWQCPIHGICC